MGDLTYRAGMGKFAYRGYIGDDVAAGQKRQWLESYAYHAGKKFEIIGRSHQLHCMHMWEVKIEGSIVMWDGFIISKKSRLLS